MPPPAGGAAEEVEELSGGNLGPVTRFGDRVLRPAGPWTPAVHELLRELRRAGVVEVPEPFGVTPEGREAVSFIPGEVGNEPARAVWVWSPQVLDDAGRLLRRVHDASTGLLRRQALSAAGDRGCPEPVWRAAVHQPVEVICHNDVAPYNLVHRDGRVVGLIDFDFASPGPRLWDLAYLAYRIVPLVGDEREGSPPPARREQRLRALIDAYGMAFDPDDVCRVAADRLDDLARFTDARAAETGRGEFVEHAALYRGDRAWLLTRIGAAG